MLTVAATVLSAAAAAKRLPEAQVVEGGALEVRGENASEVRVSNGLIVTATLRENEVTLVGASIGSAELAFADDRGTFAVMPVKVVPKYWDVLQKLLADDPDVVVEIVGGKIVLVGATANGETLRTLAEVQRLDPERIISHVTYSAEALTVIVREFLDRIGSTNVAVTVCGREVSLAGSMFDKAAAKALGERVRKLLAEFPGVTVNVDALTVRRQKILISIQFVDWDDTRARDLGLRGPDSLTAFLNFDHGFSWNGSDSSADNRSTSHESGRSGSAGSSWASSSESGSDPSQSSSSHRSSELFQSIQNGLGRTSDSLSANAYEGHLGFGVDKVEVKLNMMKKNGVAKKTYGTTLATQSGEEVKFQNGGTHYMKTGGNFSNGDVRNIEWGYNITAKPVILDDSTVNLDFNLEYSDRVDPGHETEDYDVVKYQTKSRYMMRPGESIVLSGFNKSAEAEAKHGIPFLSKIPGMTWLFGETIGDDDKQEKLLVVTVDWLLEDSDGALRRIQEMKDRKVSVEMP